MPSGIQVGASISRHIVGLRQEMGILSSDISAIGRRMEGSARHLSSLLRPLSADLHRFDCAKDVISKVDARLTELSEEIVLQENQVLGLEEAMGRCSKALADSQLPATPEDAVARGLPAELGEMALMELHHAEQRLALTAHVGAVRRLKLETDVLDGKPTTSRRSWRSYLGLAEARPYRSPARNARMAELGDRLEQAIAEEKATRATLETLGRQIAAVKERNRAVIFDLELDGKTARQTGSMTSGNLATARRLLEEARKRHHRAEAVHSIVQREALSESLVGSPEALFRFVASVPEELRSDLQRFTDDMGRQSPPDGLWLRKLETDRARLSKQVGHLSRAVVAMTHSGWNRSEERMPGLTMEDLRLISDAEKIADRIIDILENYALKVSKAVPEIGRQADLSHRIDRYTEWFEGPRNEVPETYAEQETRAGP